LLWLLREGNIHWLDRRGKYRGVFVGYVQKLRSQRKTRRDQNTDPLTLPRDQRLECWTQDAIQRSLQRCSYHFGSHAVDTEICVVPRGQLCDLSTPYVATHYAFAGAGNAGRHRLTVRVRYDWWERVYRRGLAVVDGCLVVEVSHRDKKGRWIVRAGKDYGYGDSNIYTCHARVVPTAEGKKVLQWLSS
jgi:hypothetical protein